jgi:hypothetical protein
MIVYLGVCALDEQVIHYFCYNVLLLFLSPTFQRFAVRTSKRIEDISVKGMFLFFQSL